MSEETAESAYPCPMCATPTTLAHPCPGCGRAPDPDAAAVIALDVRIQELRREADEAKQRHEELTWRLAEARRQREAHATAVRAAVAAETASRAATVRVAPAASAPPAPAASAPPAPQPAPPQVGIAGRAEASTGTVQNLLFILGGLLLGIAAIVFTVVAWARFGDVGRAAILTVVTLAVPPLVLRRGLRATAETFAALGLLLLLLDGYAAWFVNLGGIQDSWDSSFYAGTVCALTALAALIYGRLFRLTGPDFMALVAAQPVLPLFFAESGASTEVWAFVYAAIALGNVAVLRLKRAPIGFAVLAWVLHAAALLLALVTSVVAWAIRGTVLASVALVAVALVVAFGAWVGGAYAHRVTAAAVGALALAGALVRPVLPEVSAPGRLAVAAGAGALVALLAWAMSRVPFAQPAPPPAPSPQTEPVDERMPALWSTFDPAKAQPSMVAAPSVPEPNPWAIGARLGAYVSLAVPAAIALVWAALLGTEAVFGTPQAWAWQRALAVVLLAGGAALLTRGVMRDVVAVVGAVALAMMLPAPSIADIAIAAILLAWAYFHNRTGFPELAGIAALGLGAHAIAVELGEPPLRTMLAMTAVVVLGLAVAMAAPRRGYRSIGGVAAGVVDLVLPWLAFFTVAAFEGGPVASWRVLALTVLVVPLLGSARSYRGYHVVAGLVIAAYPLWPDLPGNESRAIYAGLAAVAAATVVFRCSWVWARWVATYPIAVALAWTFRDWASVLWDRGGSVNVQLPNAIAITLLLVAVLLLSRRNVLIGVFSAVLPVLMWLAYLGAPWPTLPAVTLVFGLSTVVTAVLRRMNPALVVIGTVLSVSALYGAAQERWALVAALSLVVVAMAIIAVAAKPVGARVGGWLAGAAATVWLAYETGQLAQLRPEQTAYLVLLVAGILLGLSLTRFAVAVAVEAAAHGAALVALVLTLASAWAAAGVFALWGVGVGLTALRRQAAERATSAGVLEAVAWFLLLQSYDVGTLEAYTLPIAVIAVVLGVVFARGRSSWVAYGPALGAALLPSLGAVLLTSGGEWRRLLLGIGALAVTIAGAVWRKQAPFLLGGATLIVLAVHEIVLAWKLVPTWIPLAIFGLLLVGLAITYERRRRDLARLRDAVTSMT